MMWHWGWGIGGWVGWLLMALGMVVFWGAAIVVVVWAVRSSGSKQPERLDRPPKLAVEILEERYVRGEIDLQELEEGRVVLQGRGG